MNVLPGTELGDMSTVVHYYGPVQRDGINLNSMRKTSLVLESIQGAKGTINSFFRQPRPRQLGYLGISSGKLGP